MHRHRYRRPPIDEGLVGESLALQPVFERLSRLLGQLAGIALLVGAGAEPGRQAAHLAAVKERLQAAHEAFARLARPRQLVGTFHAMARAIGLIDELTARLDRHPSGARLDDGTFSSLTDGLSAARRLLLSGSVPDLGIGLVEFAGACCALGN